MAMAYVCFFDSYVEKFARLSDEDLGKAIRAASIYRQTGEIPELDLVAGIAFDVLKSDIDQEKMNYDAKCAVNRRNGIQGGRPKNRTVISETEKTHIKENEKENEKEKEKENAKKPIPPVSPQGEVSGFGEKLQNALSDWLTYKQERGEGYGNLALRSLQAEIRAHAAHYGEGAIVQLISLTMSQNWKNLNFEKLKTLPVAGIGAADRQLDGDEIAAIKRMMSSA